MASQSSDQNHDPGESGNITSDHSRPDISDCTTAFDIEHSNIRHLEYLPDGSISATGYFDGLDIFQAQKSLLHLKEEFKRILSLNAKSEEIHDSWDLVNQSEIIPPQSVNTESSGGDPPQPPLVTNSPVEKQFLELQLFWRKRNWGIKFELYHQDDGSGKLTLQWWNRLLNWIWITLSDEHMSHLQQFLFRLRTSATSLPDISYIKKTGALRSPLQQALIQDYHKVMRAGNTEDLVRIRQRFHLTNLARSHSAYVQEYRTQGMTAQTARQHVNQLLLDIFTHELEKPVSQQTIRNHMKEARHWLEILDCKPMKGFSQGLLLLLPVQGFADIALKTCDSAWLFLFEHLPNISPRTVELAEALQPIAQSFQSRGVGKVNSPLLAYELRSHTNLHNLSRHEFNICLSPNPDLSIPVALRTVTAHGRVDNPHKIASLVKQDWERKNRRGAFAFKSQADHVRRSSQREIQQLEHQAHMRLSMSVKPTDARHENIVPANESDSDTPPGHDIVLPDFSEKVIHTDSQIQTVNSIIELATGKKLAKRQSQSNPKGRNKISSRVTKTQKKQDPPHTKLSSNCRLATMADVDLESNIASSILLSKVPVPDNLTTASTTTDGESEPGSHDMESATGEIVNKMELDHGVEGIEPSLSPNLNSVVRNMGTEAANVNTSSIKEAVGRIQGTKNDLVEIIQVPRSDSPEFLPLDIPASLVLETIVDGGQNSQDLSYNFSV